MQEIINHTASGRPQKYQACPTPTGLGVGYTAEYTLPQPLSRRLECCSLGTIASVQSLLRGEHLLELGSERMYHPVILHIATKHTKTLHNSFTSMLVVNGAGSLAEHSLG